MDALEVRFAMEALPSLRWLGLFIINCEAEGDKYLAQGVYHLLRNVEVEHSVMVAIVDSSFVDGGWVRCIWSSNCRKDFVNAVWARVRYPGSQLLKRPETEKRRLKGPGYRVDALVWR